PIAISETATLKFFGRDAAGNNSTVQTVVYTINIVEEPEDTTPPEDASNLSASPSSTTVALSWDASSSDDVAGYNVYSGETKNNSTLITGTTYTVTELTPETEYTFRVTAVDNSNNE